jgi:hypothetical protein
MQLAVEPLWQLLQDKIDSDVLRALQSAGELGERSPSHVVPPQILAYLSASVSHGLWSSHLALAAAVLIHRRLGTKAIVDILWSIHSRFTTLFPELGISSMEEQVVASVVTRYLAGEVLSQDGPAARTTFLKAYNTASQYVSHWLKTLSPALEERYRDFALPVVPRLQLRELKKRQAIQLRSLPVLRNNFDGHVTHIIQEARKRYRQLSRLRDVYHASCRSIDLGDVVLPLDFQYSEDGSSAASAEAGQSCRKMRIWDRRSFVLAYENHYAPQTIADAQASRNAFAPRQRQPFPELLDLSSETSFEPGQLWFVELIRRDVLGLRAVEGSAEEVLAKQEWLRSQGYNPSMQVLSRVAPFVARNPRLLTWTHGDWTAKFMLRAHQFSAGVCVPVEELYAAATFAMLALECLAIPLPLQSVVALQVPGAFPTRSALAADTPLFQRASPSLSKLPMEAHGTFDQTIALLASHYGQVDRITLPLVVQQDDKGNSLSSALPYLFQYSHQHISSSSLRACIRFLLHGLCFTLVEGPVQCDGLYLQSLFQWWEDAAQD